MFNKFFREKLVELLELKELQDKLDWDIFNVKDTVTSLKRVADENAEAIKFLLENIELKKDIFDKYKYTFYRATPSYIQALFVGKYGLQKQVEDGYAYLFNKEGKYVGNSNDCIGQILEVIEGLSKKEKKSK